MGESQQARSRVDDLLAEVERLGRTKKPGIRQGFHTAALLCGIPIGVALILEGWTRGSVDAYVGMTILAGSLGLARITLSPRHRYAAEQLTAFDDVRAVGPLAEALTWPDPHLRRLAIDALKRLLPKLQPADTHLLNDRQRECLCRELQIVRSDRNEAFLLAILKALCEIGDWNAIPAVEALAKGPFLQITTSAQAVRELGIVGAVFGSSRLRPSQRRVRQAATECLEILRIRADEKRAPRVLLRPSAPDAESVLLRPAAAGSGSSADRLLQPVFDVTGSESARAAEQEAAELLRLEPRDPA